MPKRKRALKEPKVDGLGPSDIKKIRAAIRQVWSWSHAKKLCIARATDKDGFGHCEKCKRRVPKVFADHIKNVGDVDRGFIERMFVPSKQLQALCKKCHDQKTNRERAEKAAREKAKVKNVRHFF